jgi:hypothetical protein
VRSICGPYFLALDLELPDAISTRLTMFARITRLAGAWRMSPKDAYVSHPLAARVGIAPQEEADQEDPDAAEYTRERELH